MAPSKASGVRSLQGRESIMDQESQWHLDKKVPLALIFAIAMQTAAALWWASKVDSRVDALERKTDNVQTQNDKIIRLEAKMENVVDGIAEIKRLLIPQKPPS
jgi:hypothetical protein